MKPTQCIDKKTTLPSHSIKNKDDITCPKYLEQRRHVSAWGAGARGPQNEQSTPKVKVIGVVPQEK